jgi:hypothetical protein
MMKLFRYDIELRFVKGVNLIVADALSRAFVCDDYDDDCGKRTRIMNRGVAAYTLSRPGVHIDRLKKNEKKCIVTFSSLIKSV